jgi:hypothetical protein
MRTGAYYVKGNDTHGFSEPCLSPKAAALAPPGLLMSRSKVVGWKAIIRQLEDQWTARTMEPEVVVAQAAGLSELWIRS